MREKKTHVLGIASIWFTHSCGDIGNMSFAFFLSTYHIPIVTSSFMTPELISRTNKSDGVRNQTLVPSEDRFKR